MQTIDEMISKFFIYSYYFAGFSFLVLIFSVVRFKITNKEPKILLSILFFGSIFVGSVYYFYNFHYNLNPLMYLKTTQNGQLYNQLVETDRLIDDLHEKWLDLIKPGLELKKESIELKQELDKLKKKDGLTLSQVLKDEKLLRILHLVQTKEAYSQKLLEVADQVKLAWEEAIFLRETAFDKYRLTSEFNEESLVLLIKKIDSFLKQNKGKYDNAQIDATYLQLKSIEETWESIK